MKSGIYTITNTTDSKMYVGKSNGMNGRKAAHWSQLKRNKHTNTHLQNAWNLYGERSFKFEELVQCPVEYLSSEEHYWCNLLDVHNRERGYNIEPTNPNGIQKHSEYVLAKMKKVWKEKIEAGYMPVYTPMTKEVAAKIVQSRRDSGKMWHTKETKQRIAEALKGKYPGIYVAPTPENEIIRKEKMKSLHKTGVYDNHKRGIVQLSLTGEYIKEWGAAREVEKELGYANAQITACCKGKWKQARGYVWKYKEEYNPNEIVVVTTINRGGVIQMSKSGEIIREWSTQKEAAKYIGIYTSHINNCCKGREPSAGGYKWKYKENNNIVQGNII